MACSLHLPDWLPSQAPSTRVISASSSPTLLRSKDADLSASSITGSISPVACAAWAVIGAQAVKSKIKMIRVRWIDVGCMMVLAEADHREGWGKARYHKAGDLPTGMGGSSTAKASLAPSARPRIFDDFSAMDIHELTLAKLSTIVFDCRVRHPGRSFAAVPNSVLAISSEHDQYSSCWIDLRRGISRSRTGITGFATSPPDCVSGRTCASC